MNVIPVYMMQKVIIFLNMLKIRMRFHKVLLLLTPRVILLRHRLVERKTLIRILLLNLRMLPLVVTLSSAVMTTAHVCALIYGARARDRFGRPETPFSDVSEPSHIFTAGSPAKCKNVNISRLWYSLFRLFYIYIPLPSRLNLQGLKIIDFATPEGGREALPSVRTFIDLTLGADCKKN